jgi:hypothetical protein
VCGGKEICEAGTELLLLYTSSLAQQTTRPAGTTSENEAARLRNVFLSLPLAAGLGEAGWLVAGLEYVLAEPQGTSRIPQLRLFACLLFLKASLSAWTGPSRYERMTPRDLRSTNEKASAYFYSAIGGSQVRRDRWTDEVK